MRFWLVLFLLLVGCANKDQKCGGKVLTLWPAAAGEYSFQALTLSTLPNPYVLSGSAAKIYYEGAIGPGGFHGAVAEPRYARSNDTCVPMDAASSAAVSVYAQFEKIKQFDDRLGIAKFLTWPRKVGIDIHLVSKDGEGHNNAHYFGSGDGIAVIPYTLKGLPMASNHGILAHEHFHAHFNAAVIIPVNADLASLPDLDWLFYPGFKPTVEDVENANLSTARGLNAFVLRAWNEGLADLYATIYTGNPLFFADSISDPKATRSLEGTLLPFEDRFQLSSFAVQRPGEMVPHSYQQGTKLARLMYRVAMSGVERPEQFLARIIVRLKDISPAIVKTYNTQVMNFEDIVPILLKDFPLKMSTCAEIGGVLTKGSKGLPQCTGV